ncbi:hypothetical protein ACQR22_03385 [Clostridium perfringens]|uniref:hypothetical protein n=1 Tax=Clostridium perfringens TaxID=1502 RepID=UPI001F592163|nr:hypothetical protein [Clostridium perfringens]MCI2778758.1 hypothetical protein [Clostridium perfringens]
MEKIERGANGYLEINSIRLELKEIHTNKIDNNKWFLKAKYEYNTNNIDFIKNIANKFINIYVCRFAYYDKIKVEKIKYINKNEIEILFEVIESKLDFEIKYQGVYNKGERKIDELENKISIREFINLYEINKLRNSCTIKTLYLDENVKKEELDNLTLDNIIAVKFNNFYENINLTSYKNIIQNKDIYKYFRHKFVFEHSNLEMEFDFRKNSYIEIDKDIRQPNGNIKSITMVVR